MVFLQAFEPFGTRAAGDGDRSDSARARGAGVSGGVVDVVLQMVNHLTWSPQFKVMIARVSLLTLCSKVLSCVGALCAHVFNRGWPVYGRLGRI